MHATTDTAALLQAEVARHKGRMDAAKNNYAIYRLAQADYNDAVQVLDQHRWNNMTPVEQAEAIAADRNHTGAAHYAPRHE